MGISSLATHAVEGHGCAAQGRGAILGHRLYDTRFPFLAKTGFERELCTRFGLKMGGIPVIRLQLEQKGLLEFLVFC